MQIAHKSQTLNLKREDRGEFSVSFHTISHDRFEDLKSFMSDFLSEGELAEYADMKIDKRRCEFLTSRYLVKAASGVIDSAAKSVSVDRGCFGQPLLRDPLRPDQSVSIAHSGAQTIVLMYPQWHTMGVDIEHLEHGQSESAKNAIYAQMTEAEMAILKSAPEHTHIQYWCLKEALSKALQCGMTGNFKTLELKDTESKDEQILETRFSQFTQYKGVSLLSEEYALGFVMPFKSEFHRPELHALKLSTQAH